MAATMGREQLFHKILVFFAIVTAITAIFNLAGSGDISLSDLGSDVLPGQVVPGSAITGYLEGANSAQGSDVTGIDFTTVTYINPNITTQIGGPWTIVSGSGIKLTGLPFLPSVLNPSALIVRNGQSISDIYSTSAQIQNPSQKDFYVFPRFIDGYSGSDIKVLFSSDGIHVKKFPLSYGFFDAGDDFFLPLQDSQITIASGSIIKTELTETVSSQNSNNPDYLSTLVVYKDGTELFSCAVRSILPGANINDQVRHGGIGSDTISFIVMGFPNTLMLDTSQSIISGSTGSATDHLASAIGFLGLLAAIFGLSKDPLVPFWLWAIVGIPCITTMALIYYEMVRGN